MSKFSNTRRDIATMAACAALWPLASAWAQTSDFPSKPITIIVPFPAGGTTDQLARAIGQRMAENMKVPVVVENKPGGGAQIAANAIKQLPSDGSTVFIGDIGALALNPHLFAKLSYDPLKDFIPLARLVVVPSMVVVPAASPYATLADLVAAVKTKPGGINIASQGNGTGGHLFAEMLRLDTRGNLNHIPYRGSAAGLTDLIGGQVDVMFDVVSTSGTFVKDGKLKALAIDAPARSPQFPQVPTLQELGFGQLSLTIWFGLAVKAGTPAPVVNRLGDEVIKAMRSPEVSRRFTDQGVEVATMTPAEFKAFMETESQRWGKVIKDAGIKLD